MALPSADDAVWKDSGMACVLVQERVELYGAQHVAEQLLEEQFQDHLHSLCLDLVPLLATSITTPEVLQLFHHMTRVCSAKEMNLALLEALDTDDSLPVALKLLHPLQSVMDRLPASGKLRVVGSTARAVFQCLQNLRQRQKGMVSRSDDLERSADSCEEDEEGVAKLCTTTDLEYVVGMLGFWRAASGVFLHAWLETEGRVDNELLPLQSACISGLLSLLGDPIATVDLVDSATGPSSASSTGSGQLAKQTVELLSLLKCGLHTLVSEGPPSLSTAELSSPEPLNEVGLACLCYLWMAEGVCWSIRPTPLRDEYLVLVSFKQAAVLLNSSKTVCVKKGLCLVQKCFELVACGSLDRTDLMDSSCMDLLQALANVAVYCDSKTLRTTSVTAFRQVVELFDAEARHRVYRILFHQITHSGLWGLLVHDLKNEVNRAIKGNSPVSPFLGDRLLPLLYVVCRLPTLEEETAVLKESDRLMAVVNFLRFLLLADNPILNKTNVWHHVDYWRTSLCQPLLDAVERSKDHHGQMLAGAKGNDKGRGSEEGVSLPEVAVNISGKVLRTADLEEWDDKQALVASLLQLEMLQETTVRLMEIMKEHQVSEDPDAT